MRSKQPSTALESEVSREVLAYLADHPHAADTVEGIARWWLGSERHGLRREIVERALALLVERGLAIKMVKGDGEAVFCGVVRNQPSERVS